MRVAYGLLGAILGFFVGGAATLLGLSIAFNGDSFGVVMMAVGFGWIGLLIGALVGIAGGLLVRKAVQYGSEQPGGHARKRNMLVGWTAGPLILTIFMLWQVWEMGQPPSDEAMLQHFRNSQATFDQLVGMIKTDHNLLRVDQDWTNPSDPATIGISKTRIGIYRSLLRQAGVSRGFDANSSADDIVFYYYLQGSAVSSDEDKGYAYLVTPPAQQVASLDHISIKGGQEVESYRHITGNWYLFYSFQPDD